MSSWNSNTAMAFLLLYILEKEFSTLLSAYGNGDLHHAIRETLDELAFDRVGDLYAAHAEQAFESKNEIGLIDTRDFAEDVIRVIPPGRPSVGRAHKILGYVCFRQGDQEAGREHFEKAMEIFKRQGMAEELSEVEGFLREYINDGKTFNFPTNAKL